MRSRIMAMITCFLMLAAIPLETSWAEEQCGGTDMLAEMARSKPAVFEKINTEARALENTQALLWRIEKAGVDASYLFGTMHLSDRRVTTLKPSVETALKSARTVILEIADLSPAALTSAMSVVNGADLVYADGRTLADQLTPEEFEKVKKVVSSSGLPGDAAGMLKPWLVSTLLAVSECERRQTASGAQVLDMKLASRAKEAAIPVVGLETIEQQLAALAGIPEDQQLQMLRVSLKYYERTADMMETMLQLYLKRDMGAAMPFQKALAAEMGVGEDAFEGFQKSLLLERNARMSAEALPHLAKGSAFIAVGALHLPGKAGLVALLREAGYTVTPIE